ncbi:hypothetical protein XW59_008800 [Aquamicrobium sp. LC103]|nr:hypothetical protein XW59_008800 [Aquamicrobium sp. LC103]
MSPVAFIILGAVIFGATFAAWWWLNAFACGMNPTGCGEVELRWDDWEALRFFVPTFAIGAMLMAIGFVRKRAR